MKNKLVPIHNGTENGKRYVYIFFRCTLNNYSFRLHLAAIIIFNLCIVLHCSNVYEWKIPHNKLIIRPIYCALDFEIFIFKSPQVTGGLIVFGPFPPPLSPPPPFCQHFSIFQENPLKLISSNHIWLTYGCRKTFGPISVTLGQVH